MKVYVVMFMLIESCLLLFTVPASGDNDFSTRSHTLMTPKLSDVLLPANPSRLTILGRGLGFPFKETKDIRELKAYGIAPWGGESVHNGIDILVDNTGEHLKVGDKITVVSPADGIVRAVLHLNNPYNSETPQWILVVIEINSSLLATLSFEPQTAQRNLQEIQARSISVQIGDKVKEGQKIGNLVVGEGTAGGGKPHIDIRLLLKDPSTTIDAILATGASHNDLSNLPTFLCPFDYSSIPAKEDYERVIHKGNPDTECQCPCKFPYNGAECGIGCGN